MRCFFYETIENLNCQGCQIRQPIDKKHWQTEVFYYVFWSILGQMTHVCCEIFQKKKKLYAPWWNFASYIR